MSAPAILLEARGLAAWRGARPVLHGVDLALRASEAVALVGPNAAGKSTLVRALAGLLRPAAGEVRLLDRRLDAWSRDAVARAIALVTSEEDGAPALAVRDRVALGRYPHRGPLRPYTDVDRAAVDRALRLAGIEGLAERTLGTLSAGERQLAALARGLAQEPQVLLLDEPAAHLDIGHELQLFRILDEIRAAGVAVLAVVHDLGRAALWAERMVLVFRGRIAKDGMPDEVLRSPAAAEAFGVRVRGHAVEGLAHPLYSFE
ncbi:MAG TPA: ABC transporter ATP-binding protein [Vicinamibacteria bacterium]|nr:ABC transporter ATP-binding protein [Vicinamibacteria bacterium]